MDNALHVSSGVAIILALAATFFGHKYKKAGTVRAYGVTGWTQVK